MIASSGFFSELRTLQDQLTENCIYAVQILGFDAGLQIYCYSVATAVQYIAVGQLTVAF
jgi:hypothetical protein